MFSDHVAIILKFEAESKDLFFLDATSAVNFLKFMYRVWAYRAGHGLDSLKILSIHSIP